MVRDLGTRLVQLGLDIAKHKSNFNRYTVETRYSKPIKSRNLILMVVLLRYRLYSHKQLYIITSEMRTPRYSVKRTDSSVLLVSAQYKIHWIMQTLACPSPPLLSNSTTGHYNSTGMYSTGLWSAFLASVQQGRVLERSQQHGCIGMPTGNTLEASEIWMPL